MRTAIHTIVVAMACVTMAFCVGCERKPTPKADPDRRDVEVNAPGVDVKVDSKNDDVEVNAPGVKVDTEPDDKVDVKVGE
jgi:hypothetical protein